MEICRMAVCRRRIVRKNKMIGVALAETNNTGKREIWPICCVAERDIDAKRLPPEMPGNNPLKKESNG